MVNFFSSIYRNNMMMLLVGPALSGVSVYLILSYLLIPPRIILPFSLIMSTLIFALANYYYYYFHNNYTTTRPNIREETESSGREQGLVSASQNNDDNNNKFSISILFITIYIASLLVIAFSSNPNSDLFVPWRQLTLIQIIQLMSAIMLSFFLPGYAVLSILDKKYEFRPLLKVLLSYIFSTLATGLTGYITASLGFAISHITMLLITVYVLMLIPFILQQLKISLINRSSYNRSAAFRILLPKFHLSKFSILLGKDKSELLIFASLFALVVLSTYYLYDGLIIGDQWFHHGRALIFMSGAFKDLAIHHIDSPEVPPFLSALLAVFFSLSGIPSVNAYVSINFLNIIPVFAFYYFFTKWVPIHRRKAILLASTLFMLSSGFGWIYVLNMAIIHPPTSQLSVLNTLFLGAMKTLDVRVPNTFIDVGDPNITTNLIIISLPAGFILLGLLKEERLITISNKFKYTNVIIVASISTLGIFSHDEFYLFIIVACILTLIFKLSKKNYLFAGILIAISIVILEDTVLLENYYTLRKIFGIPIIALCFLIVSIIWALYLSNSLQIIQHLFKKKLLQVLRKFTSVHTRFQYTIGIIIISVIAFFYIFSFLVWGPLSPIDVYINTNFGHKTIPWYFYPMKFGVAGLFGLAFILSYLFKKFEKEVFVFGVIAIIAFILGPYYDEHRLGKYIMVGMVGFASLLIYRIIILLHLQRFKIKPLICGVLIGLVVISSSLSILMYIGYYALVWTSPLYRHLEVRRDFPSSSEIHLLSFLYNKLINSRVYENVALSANEYNLANGFIAKLEGFSGIPRAKLLQSPLTLNASTLEALYSLLDYSDTRYIVLAKKDIKAEGDTGREELPKPISFALKNFPKPYQNSNYLVLAVPDLAPPSSKGDVALIYYQNNNNNDDNNNDSRLHKLLSSPESDYNNENYYYNHYYPLSALALSRIPYDTFINGDFTAFSKKKVVLTLDPLKDDVSRYLEFVKFGGTLIVLNTVNNNFEGKFGKFLSIKPGRMVEFDGITDPRGQTTLKIPGLTRDIELKSSDVTAKSFYIKNNKVVAPFAIEKKYEAGKIIFVNTFGYFDAISKSADRFFLSLANISNLIDLKAEKYPKASVFNSIPTTRFIGDLKLSGQIMINSSSVLVDGSHNFHVEDISLSNTNDPGQDLKANFKNVLIKDLKLYGTSEVVINSTGTLYLPSSSSSRFSSSSSPHYDYMTISIPSGSNMTLKLSNGASAEFMTGNYSQPFRFNESKIIIFHKIKGGDLLIKSPEIELNGSFKSLYWSPRASGESGQINGKITMKVDHVDYYQENIDNKVTLTQYLAYLKWIHVFK